MIIFDLCGTVYKSNTTFDFIRYFFPVRAKIIFSPPIRLFSYALKKSIKWDLIKFLAIWQLRGISRERLDDMSEDFYGNFLINRQNLDVIRLLTEAPAERVVIASASIEPIVKVVSMKLGVCRYVSSTLSYVDGRCAGLLDRDILGCKAQYLPNKPIGLVVTDNRSDMDIIRLSSRAILVTGKSNLPFWLKNKRADDTVLEI